MISIRNNPAASASNRELQGNYGRLSTSLQRLSTGLRVNSSADDAAGLAIRELMRSDIAALQQGSRNANDAISMIQVADGALGVIDEKLIRMKELAEQAATGTYDSTQRMMIDSEFQAMGKEIDRIANATDFNGIKLLDGSLSGAHDGSRLNSNGAMKIHFGTANDSAEDYYYVKIDDCTTKGLGLRELLPFPNAPNSVAWINEAQIDYVGRHIILDIPDAIAGASSAAFTRGLDFYALPVGLENITVTSNSVKTNPFHKPHVCLFASDGVQLTGPRLPHPSLAQVPYTVVVNSNGDRAYAYSENWWNNINGQTILDKGIAEGIFDAGAALELVSFGIPINPGETISAGSGANAFTITTPTGQNEIGSLWTSKRLPGDRASEEIIEIDKITSDLVFFIGGHDNPGGGCNRYRLRIEADITETFLRKLKGWEGDGTSGEVGGLLKINTQEKAQKALVAVTRAIVSKDNVRAQLGAMQNRLENTATNLLVQQANLQAAEARISDTDIAREMTQFVRCQILTQSATAMLGHANTYPQMLMRLLGN